MRRQLGVRPSVAGEVPVGLCSAESSVISMPSGGTLGSDARLSLGGVDADKRRTFIMGLGRGMLLWLIGIPIPIIVLIALLWHH
jgi:hypothetical protein